MKIYEIIFFGDSPKKIPFICEIKNEAECERFQQGISYKNEEDIEIKIIQQGLKDNFLKNTQKLLLVDKKVKKVMGEKGMEDIEYVPVKIEKEEYYIMNILKMIYGSLNIEKSIVLRYPDDFPNEIVRGEMGAFGKQYYFNIKNKDIFLGLRNFQVIFSWMNI